MRKKLQVLLLCLGVMALLLSGCQSAEVHTNTESTVVRVYDVEAQDREDVKYLRHLSRVGLLETLGDCRKEPTKALFYDQIPAIQYNCGIEFEYVVLDTWEELRQEMEKTRGDGSTKIILFNNSYDESLIRELSTGGYADLSDLLEENGVYNKEEYQQEVLAAGKVVGKQVTVPILYNVPSMVGAVQSWTPEELTYQDCLERIQQKMQTDKNYAQMAQMSAAYLDGAEPDLMLPAAGEPWEEYEDQRELFELLLQYVSDFQEYQVNPVSLQGQWAEWLSTHPANEFPNMSGRVLDEGAQRILRTEGEGEFLWQIILSQTAYVTECSQPESIAFHSTWGLINSSYVINTDLFKQTRAFEDGNRTMGYWPIGTQRGEGYAAQPICMASVMDDGDAELAFQVIKAFLDYPQGLDFGFGLKKENCNDRIQEWIEKTGDYFGYATRGVSTDMNEHKLVESFSGVSELMYMRRFENEDRALYGEVLLQQLNDVAFAQLCDREIETIWQETLLESVQEGLSAEAGFERLCDRMDAYWAKFE